MPPGSGAFGAPLYVGWQLTNECNLSCLHCIEESGPGKAFKDELSREEALGVLGRLAVAQVPYLSFSGGEPMLHPAFWELVEAASAREMEVKIETNGHLLSPDDCARLRELGVKAVQVSLDGAGPASYEGLRVGGRFERAVQAVEDLRSAGTPVEINFSPTKFNAHEVGRAVDLAFEWGAAGFYSGRTIIAGNAAKTRGLIEPTEEQYERFFRTLREKAREYEGRMRVCFHELGLIEELNYRLANPAALFIILPNGKVKLINALPFICGDLRRQGVSEVWKSFLDGWRSPQVREFVSKLQQDPGGIGRLHEWAEVRLA
ncbi:MAG: radical SAM protein [Elusimicrobia bacterium]|nr:radical SAM protein [Elusimicrobiota bacterium]